VQSKFISLHLKEFLPGKHSHPLCWTYFEWTFLCLL